MQSVVLAELDSDDHVVEVAIAAVGQVFKTKYIAAQHPNMVETITICAKEGEIDFGIIARNGVIGEGIGATIHNHKWRK